MPANKQTFSGAYHTRNPANGVKIVLKLQQESDSVIGSLVLNHDESYRIEGNVSRETGIPVLNGSIRNGIEHSKFEAVLEKNHLLFRWFTANGNSSPGHKPELEVMFLKNNPAEKMIRDDGYETISIVNRRNGHSQRDLLLVGRWHNTETVPEKYIDLMADGTYLFLNGKTAGNGETGSSATGNDHDVIQGKWFTENNLLYFDEGAGFWSYYAGYYIEGNSLLFKFHDGSRKLWTRVS